jgi:hypothetical protein
VLTEPGVAVTETDSPGKTEGGVALQARVIGGAFLHPIGKKARHVKARTRQTDFKERKCISNFLRNHVDNQGGKVRSSEQIPVRVKSDPLRNRNTKNSTETNRLPMEALRRAPILIDSPESPKKRKNAHNNFVTR